MAKQQYLVRRSNMVEPFGRKSRRQILAVSEHKFKLTQFTSPWEKSLLVDIQLFFSVPTRKRIICNQIPFLVEEVFGAISWFLSFVCNPRHVTCVGHVGVFNLMAPRAIRKGYPLHSKTVQFRPKLYYNTQLQGVGGSKETRHPKTSSPVARVLRV